MVTRDDSGSRPMLGGALTSVELVGQLDGCPDDAPRLRLVEPGATFPRLAPELLEELRDLQRLRGAMHLVLVPGDLAGGRPLALVLPGPEAPASLVREAGYAALREVDRLWASEALELAWPGSGRWPPGALRSLLTGLGASVDRHRLRLRQLFSPHQHWNELREAGMEASRAQDVPRVPVELRRRAVGSSVPVGGGGSPASATALSIGSGLGRACDSGDECLPEPARSRAVALVDALAAQGVPAAFGGSVALRAFGLSRPSHDVDLNLFLPRGGAEAHADRLLATLRAWGGRPERGEAWDHAPVRSGIEAGRLRAEAGGVRFDLFFPSLADPGGVGARAVLEAAEASRVRLAGARALHVLAPEVVCCFKLLFGRPDDLADVRGFVQSRGDELDLGWVTHALGRQGQVGAEAARAWQEIVSGARWWRPADY